MLVIIRLFLNRLIRNNYHQKLKQIVANHLMPFAFVDINVLSVNIRAIVPRENNKQIRVASKNVR